MNIIAVDDERHALLDVERALKRLMPEQDISCFLSAKEALEYARAHQIDVAFLDIDMAEMNGLYLAKTLKEIYAKTNIIFVTGYSSYMQDAFYLRVSGYVLKPINIKQLEHELEDLRYPVTAPDQGIRIQCFGNFEIFVDGRPIIFKRPKSKEILAYLTDRRGASISRKELAAILWEDTGYSRSIQSHLHILIVDMMAALAEVHAEHIIIKKRGYYALDVTKVSCDYYRFVQGDAEAVNSYRGEYMLNYSWGEFRIAEL